MKKTKNTGNIPHKNKDWQKRQKNKRKPNDFFNKKIIGKISINSKGTGFVTPENKNTESKKNDRNEDILIEEKDLLTSLHGDIVEISLNEKLTFGRKSGRVLKIIEREKNTFVGTLEKKGNLFFVVPDDQRIHKDIFVSKENLKEAKENEKVQIKITKWINPLKNPEGEIIKVIGKKGENDTEIKAIVLEKGFDIEFEDKVEKEAKRIKQEEKPIKEEEIKKRRDFRNITTFTIDPFDAKDFDDAISYKEIDQNTLEIGVHIADVSHYVRPETELEKEALNRGCSVYLVDRTIPMLPEILSNDLCSLNPNEDKLAFSAVFEINKKTGSVVKSWFGKTIINSNKRFTYENAQETLNSKTGEFFKELEELNRIAKILQKKKHLEGAIDFETTEVKFKLNEKGKPLTVFKKERLDTHKLVEEFMLLANREVAEFIFKASKHRKGLVGVYRIHDVPKPEKISDLRIFLKALGHDLPGQKGEVSSQDINKLLKKIEGSPHENLIKTATIRSMEKAIYSIQNVGHFGLAFKYYTHFTSPIRRYPDILVHRIMQNIITKRKFTQNEYAKFEKIMDKCSVKEIKATEAERMSIKMKQVEYMSDFIGKDFEGIISGVAQWGIFVEEVETKCEGMIRLKDIKEDYFELDQKNYRVIGQKTKKIYSLGDKIKFKVKSANIEKKTLDYSLVS